MNQKYNRALQKRAELLMRKETMPLKEYEAEADAIGREMFEAAGQSLPIKTGNAAGQSLPIKTTGGKYE